MIGKISNGDKIAITALSNPVLQKNKDNIYKLIKLLEKTGLTPITSKFVFDDSYDLFAAPKKKTAEIEEFFLNPEIKMIFDISGGDISNSCLPYMNFDVIKRYAKPFAGYSDLSAVLNAIYSKTGIKVILYQIMNLILDKTKAQYRNFFDAFINGRNTLFDFEYEFIQGDYIEGTVIGGNIRCFLKLAGTSFFPDLKGKILFLESLSGNEARIFSYLNQLAQIKDFNRISGIIFGTFTELEGNNSITATQEYQKEVKKNLGLSICKKNIPLVFTGDIGHGNNSKALILGENLALRKKD